MRQVLDPKTWPSMKTVCEKPDSRNDDPNQRGHRNERKPRGNLYSTLMPARLTTSAHLAISAFMNGSMSFSAMVDGSPAPAAMRCLTSGSASAFVTSAFSFATIGCGVPLGAHSPNQV